MTENKIYKSRIYKSANSAQVLMLLAATFSILLPVYGDDTDSNAIKSEKAVMGEKASSQTPDGQIVNGEKIEGKGGEEVKQQLAAAVKIPGDKEKAKAHAPKKSKTKIANEQMSSDDTTKEYVRSVDPTAHYEKARALTLEKKYPEALKEINAALIQNPKYYEAQYLGALIYEEQGRKQEAANKYKALLNIKPNYLQVRISYASLLADLDQNKAAETEYRKAIDLAFMSCEAHYNFANLLTKESRFKEALQELRICLKLKPDDAAVHNNLGVIYFHQNYKEESEKEFRQASELDPANKIYVHNLELVRAKDKRVEVPSLG